MALSHYHGRTSNRRSRSRNCCCWRRHRIPLDSDSNGCSPSSPSANDHDDKYAFHLHGHDHLKIRSFHLCFSLVGSTTDRLLPEALTLLYLGTPLEINDAKIQPGIPAFVTLDRNRRPSLSRRCTDRVITDDGTIRYEVYVSADRVLRDGVC